jgi:sulfur-oxidizing protein SoxX
MPKLSYRQAWMTGFGGFFRLFAAVAIVAGCAVVEAAAGAQSRVDRGRELAHDFNKGNCLACHAAPRDATAVTLANIAPPLVMIRERYPDREALHRHIWDPMRRNPNTIMPPYGKHRILTDEEIDLVIDYLYTL